MLSGCLMALFKVIYLKIKSLITGEPMEKKIRRMNRSGLVAFKGEV